MERPGKTLEFETAVERFNACVAFHRLSRQPIADTLESTKAWVGLPPQVVDSRTICELLLAVGTHHGLAHLLIQAIQLL